MSSIRYDIVHTAPIEAIVALYEEAGWWKESKSAREAVPAMITGSFCFMVAMTEENKIIGMGRVISDGVSDGYIQDLTVLKAFRRQGIGRELLVRLTRYCQEKRLEWIGLVAEPNTTRFYEANGFKELKNHVPMRCL
ncbi:MAG: hypothetical protein A2293_13195 [Elusimicrobia bacterium RIFOXYB2_FULL_49_7]|nr:MAG: hypothetical protein A2293_13195 [Elusimicrobia bacterium RIFOXYB2_FULL_49_7]